MSSQNEVKENKVKDTDSYFNYDYDAMDGGNFGLFGCIGTVAVIFIKN